MSAVLIVVSAQRTAARCVAEEGDGGEEKRESACARRMRWIGLDEDEEGNVDGGTRSRSFRLGLKGW